MNQIPPPSLGEHPDIETATQFVSQIYSVMLDEVDDAQYSSAELEMMRDTVMYYGRYLKPGTRYYFEQTVIPPIAAAVNYVTANGPATVLDLGCGLGMQSIIFALAGCRVIAVDIRPSCIALCNKRKQYFEERFGQKLDIEFLCENFAEFSSADRESSIDAVFSMSAFSYILPLQDTVKKLSKLSRPDARVFLFEENIDHFYAALFRRRNIPGPRAVKEAFEAEGFAGGTPAGTCAIPKQVWSITAMRPIISMLDRVLRKSIRLAFSYKLSMQRVADPTATVID
tara:strand:+ start:1036 stop:1887 length:852 start_codon:yes stop_codon:yes gene_type:complete